ncbi:MAG: nodulation protein NodN [Rhodobacteraceae bacterium]|nr:MAG: nodulation protein NodN [Paracoccaceae bacterium]
MSDTTTNYEFLQSMQGAEIGVSEWILIDQSKIDDFARVTQDDQFIHVNPERAKNETDFGGTIAHGFLVLSLASKFSLDVLGQNSQKSVSINYGFDKVRFISPVLANSLVRGRFNLKRVDIDRPTELRQIYDLSIEIKGLDRPAIIAEWITLTIYNN